MSEPFSSKEGKTKIIQKKIKFMMEEDIKFEVKRRVGVARNIMNDMAEKAAETYVYSTVGMAVGDEESEATKKQYAELFKEEFKKAL